MMSFIAYIAMEVSLTASCLTALIIYNAIKEAARKRKDRDDEEGGAE